jgi:hypothetical protein
MYGDISTQVSYASAYQLNGDRERLYFQKCLYGKQPWKIQYLPPKGRMDLCVAVQKNKNNPLGKIR